MQKSSWLRHVSKAVLIAAALLLSRESVAASAQGAILGQSMIRLPVGWSQISISECIALQSNGTDLLVVVPTTGSSNAIVFVDPNVFIAGAGFCANGNGFFIFTPDGATVTEIVLQPGLR